MVGRRDLGWGPRTRCDDRVVRNSKDGPNKVSRRVPVLTDIDTNALDVNGQGGDAEPLRPINARAGDNLSNLVRKWIAVIRQRKSPVSQNQNGLLRSHKPAASNICGRALSRIHNLIERIQAVLGLGPEPPRRSLIRTHRHRFDDHMIDATNSRRDQRIKRNILPSIFEDRDGRRSAQNRSTWQPCRVVLQSHGISRQTHDLVEIKADFAQTARYARGETNTRAARHIRYLKIVERNRRGQIPHPVRPKWKRGVRRSGRSRLRGGRCPRRGRGPSGCGCFRIRPRGGRGGCFGDGESLGGRLSRSRG
jgi:hypothetical protein